MPYAPPWHALMSQVQLHKTYTRSSCAFGRSCRGYRGVAAAYSALIVPLRLQGRGRRCARAELAQEPRSGDWHLQYNRFRPTHAWCTIGPSFCLGSFQFVCPVFVFVICLGCVVVDSLANLLAHSVQRKNFSVTIIFETSSYIHGHSLGKLFQVHQGRVKVSKKKQTTNTHLNTKCGERGITIKQTRNERAM